MALARKEKWLDVKEHALRALMRSFLSGENKHHESTSVQKGPCNSSIILAACMQSPLSFSVKSLSSINENIFPERDSHDRFLETGTRETSIHVPWGVRGV